MKTTRGSSEAQQWLYDEGKGDEKETKEEPGGDVQGVIRGDIEGSPVKSLKAFAGGSVRTNSMLVECRGRSDIRRGCRRPKGR
jgi:hypothetical protein